MAQRTVWHANNANAPQQAALESVQHQMAVVGNTTSTYTLRIETGCRSFESWASWADQRKLEYFFKLQEMPDCRLPKLVSLAAQLAGG